MITFKDAIQKKNVDYNKGYICNMCNMIRYEKPFINYIENVNDNNDDTKNMWTGTKEKVNLFLFFCFVIFPVLLCILVASLL